MYQVVIKCGDHLLESWVSNMTTLLPEFQTLPYNSPSIEPDRVHYVIGWCPDAIWVNGFPNIKALVSIGSGVDHIIHLDQLRSDIPVIRTVSPDLSQRMREYVAMCVLTWHRQLIPIIRTNAKKVWDRFAVATADEVTVGIMGYGGMGAAAARTLDSLGYNVAVWASSPKEDVPFDYSYGREALLPFASKCDVLVCLLPLTDETEGILDYSLLTSIKKDGCLVNAARGKHLVEADLKKAMDEQHLSYAFLDGLNPEPLPSTATIWDIENVLITCHSAAYISPELGPKIIAKNIRAFDEGKDVGPMYDPQRGF